jgi:SecD/SecF fusion protein
MKSLIRISLLCLLGLVLLGALGIGSWYGYRAITRPTMEGAGGTILVYETDVDDAPIPANYKAEEMTEALLRRLDPGSGLGITVRSLNETRMEISIPRSGDHAAQVQHVKDLLTQVGLLEFRILANLQDDKEGIETARTYIEGIRDANEPEDRRAERKRELEDRASRGLPPPPPRSADGGNAFPWSNPWGRGEATYSWVELGRSERMSLNLDNAAKDDPQRNQRWKDVAKAREEGRTFVLRDMNQTILYGRPCTNFKLTPNEQASKQYEYFLLTRDPKPGESITGQYLVNATETLDHGQQPAIAFRFNKQGGDLFYDITSWNKPSGGAGYRFFRHIAIILDSQVVSAPRLNEAIRSDGQISGNFTQKEVQQIVNILRGGALPARLKPLPVSETVVEPK